MSERGERKVIGNNVRRLRTSAGLTQLELAERAKLSVTTIGRIELGQSSAAKRTLEYVALALGTSVDDLANLGQVDSMPRIDGATFEQRLGQELAIINWRGLIVVVVAAPGSTAVADNALARAATDAGIGDDEILRHIITRDAQGRERLRAHNRMRDRLIKQLRIVYLRASSAADVRFLREVAPDLTAAIDVFVEIEASAPDGNNWEACRVSLCALMKERHEMLDFTGLLPANVEQRMLPLSQLYQDLVEIYPHQAGLFDDHRNGWLILGHPGSGKTTYLRHLAWTYATGGGDPLDIGAKVPLLLSLSDYSEARADDRVRSLVDFLPQYLNNEGVASAGAIVEHLSDILLLLDGLDEMSSVEVRRVALAELGELRKAGRLGAVVVTGRSFLVDELGGQDRLRLATTRPPTPEQMQAFVSKFVQLRRGPARHARDFISRIERDADLRALARTPLMLAFMVILDELEGRLPDRRIEIYYRLGEMLVDRWTKARSIGTSTSRRERPTRADAMRVLGPLAWWTLERGGGVVPESALLREIERIEARREVPAEATRRAEALLELLRSDAALLVPRLARHWSFVHQSIAEYFAGVEVERDPRRWQALLDDPFRSDWREIVLFCAGQLGTIDGRVERLDELIDVILKKSKRGGRYDAKYPSLLIGLLAESPGLSRKQIDRLADRLLDLVFTKVYSFDAMFQFQAEFVVLLRDAHGSVRESLSAALARMFSVGSRIRWDRVFPWGDGDEPVLDASESTIRLIVRAMLGPFGVSLVEPWVQEFDIDLQPSVAEWSKRDGWAYRLAVWWVHSAPADRDRPFADLRL